MRAAAGPIFSGLPGLFDIYNLSRYTAGSSGPSRKAPEKNRLSDTTQALEPLAQELAQERYQTVKEEAEKQLQEGQEEYEKGLRTYETQRQQSCWPPAWRRWGPGLSLSGPDGHSQSRASRR